MPTKAETHRRENHVERKTTQKGKPNRRENDAEGKTTLMKIMHEDASLVCFAMLCYIDSDFSLHPVFEILTMKLIRMVMMLVMMRMMIEMMKMRMVTTSPTTTISTKTTFTACTVLAPRGPCQHHYCHHHCHYTIATATVTAPKSWLFPSPCSSYRC